LADPTPEELAAWQAQQFSKGQQTLQKRKEETMDPLQKRRLALRNSAKKDDGGDDEEWEEIAALPDLQGQSSVFFSNGSSVDDDDDGVVVIGVSPLLHTLATSPQGDPELLGTTWQRLYSSIEGDGLSFWNLWHELCGYDGPTLMLLNVVPSRSKLVRSPQSSNTETTATIGFFTTTTWHESTEYIGNHSAHETAFLFAMDEQENQVEFFGINEKNKSKKTGYMYCHPSTGSRKSRGGTNYHQHNDGNHVHDKTDGAVHGIGIGGKPSQPRLHLTETLEDCRCLTYDSSRNLKDGDLFLNKTAFQDSLYYFDVEAIEVWGCGGKAWIQDALQAREKARGITSSNLLRRRRVFDKSQLLDDFRNGLHSTTTKSYSNGSYFDHVGHAVDRCDV